MDLDIHEMDMQLASANDEIRDLQRRLEMKRAVLAKARALVNHQRLNEGLWKPPMSTVEHQLQQAIRALHIILEDK